MFEGIAALHLAGIVAVGEPAHALLCRAVGEGIGHDVPLRLLLDHVVADGVGGRATILDVARFQAVVMSW